MQSTEHIISPTEIKRQKNEPKTYSSKRGYRRSSNSTAVPTSPTKSPKTREKHVPLPVVILDNGVHTAKLGVSTNDLPQIVPNCIMKVKSERKRFFVGNQIEDCRDLSGLYYMLASEKGYITKWNIQKPVWDYMFSNVCPIDDKPVVMTQPIFNFKAVQEITDEIFFEEYEVKSMLRVNPTDLAKYEYTNKVIGHNNVPCLIIDSGFSFTHIIPYINGKKYYKGIIRMNIGGKVLTNHLKDIISYRQLHVMDETHVINQVKEDACFVSLNFKEDMRVAGLHGLENTIVKNYVLPDFNIIRRGYLQDSANAMGITEGCQILRLNNERFTVPEILFHPTDIGMESMGLAENIVKSIKSCPLKDQPLISKNIVLIGGNVNFPGYKERLYSVVRSYLPDHWDVNVFKPDNPIIFPWQGGKSLSYDPKIKSLLITKEQYEETGPSFTYDRFSDWIHFKQIEEDDVNKLNEIRVDSEGILNSGKFNRFDLFGKHEMERIDTTAADEGSAQASSQNKMTDNTDSKDSKDKHQEVESQSLHNADALQEDANDGNKTNEKVSKNKSLANQQTDYNDILDCIESEEQFELTGFDFGYV